MKYLFILMLLASCTSRNSIGECIGINDKEDPTLEYKYSTRNIIVGLVFVELIIPPVMVALEQIKCPIGPKK